MRYTSPSAHFMKKFLLTAIIVLACAQAHAGDPNLFPSDMRGTWCPKTNKTFVRCTTKNRDSIQISPTDVRSKKNQCNVTTVDAVHFVIVAEMECIDGGKTTNVTSVFSITDQGRLRIQDWEKWKAETINRKMKWLKAQRAH